MNSVDVIHKFDERAGNSVAFGRIQSKVSNSDHFRVSQAPLDLRSVEKRKENPGIEQPGSRALTWPELTHTHTSTGPLLVKRRIKKPTKKTKRINLSNSDETRKNPIRFAADGPRVPLVGNGHVTRPYRTALIPFIGRPERLVRVSRFAVCVLLLFFFLFFPPPHQLGSGCGRMQLHERIVKRKKTSTTKKHRSQFVGFYCYHLWRLWPATAVIRFHGRGTTTKKETKESRSKHPTDFSIVVCTFDSALFF